MLQQDEGHSTATRPQCRGHGAAGERMSEGQGAGGLAGLALHAVPERWAFLVGSSFEKAGKRQQEPQGMRCQQERHRLAVTGVRVDCS